MSIARWVLMFSFMFGVLVIVATAGFMGGLIGQIIFEVLILPFAVLFGWVFEDLVTTVKLR